MSRGVLDHYGGLYMSHGDYLEGYWIIRGSLGVETIGVLDASIGVGVVVRIEGYWS